MVIAILIGFRYKNEIEISCTYTDLHRAYSYSIKNKWKTYILTDIPLIFHKAKVLTTSNIKELINNLIKLLKLEDKIFIYYTGHAISSGFELPDNNILSYEEFRKILTINTNSKSQQLIILDCCYASSLNLPYSWKIDSNRFRLNESKDFNSRDITVVTSSTNTERSAATLTRSFFSKYFFSVLDNKLGDIILIIKELITKENSLVNQNVSIHSTYPDKIYLPYWFLNKKDINKFIAYDPIIECLEIIE